MWFQNLYKSIKNSFKYWYEKREELKYLKLRDMKQAYIISQIALFTQEKTNEYIYIKNIKLLHPVNRISALKKIKEREVVLKQNQEKIVQREAISRENLDKYIPSITPMKVIKFKNRQYVIWEGNGRLVALEKVFGKNLMIEVEEHVLNEEGQDILTRLLEDLFSN